jgi:hypothetical protein
LKATVGYYPDFNDDRVESVMMEATNAAHPAKNRLIPCRTPVKPDTAHALHPGNFRLLYETRRCRDEEAGFHGHTCPYILSGTIEENNPCPAHPPVEKFLEFARCCCRMAESCLVEYAG